MERRRDVELLYAMNLLHFLSVSPSFEGGKDAPAYRIKRGEWLPRFGMESAGGMACGSVGLAAPSSPAMPASDREVSGMAPSAVAHEAAPASRLARSRGARLSLDNVEVVRNDLSDSDFEIVRRRSARVAVERTTSTLAAIERFAGRRALHWLSARWFRLGRTQA